MWEGYVEYSLVNSVEFFSWSSYLHMETPHYIFNEMNYRFQWPEGKPFPPIHNWYVAMPYLYDFDSVGLACNDALTFVLPDPWYLPSWWTKDFFGIRGSLHPFIHNHDIELGYVVNSIYYSVYFQMWFYFKEYFFITFAEFLYLIYTFYLGFPIGFFIIFVLLFIYWSTDFWTIAFAEFNVLSFDFFMCYILYISWVFCLFFLVYFFFHLSYMVFKMINRFFYQLRNWARMCYDNYYWWHHQYYYKKERDRKYYADELVLEYQRILRITILRVFRNICCSTLIGLNFLRISAFKIFSSPLILPYFFWVSFCIYYCFRLFKYFVIGPFYFAAWRISFALRNALGQIQQVDVFYHLSRVFWDWNRYAGKLWEQATEQKPIKVFFLSVVSLFRPVDLDYKKSFKVSKDNLTKASRFYKFFYVPVYMFLCLLSTFFLIIYLSLSFFGSFSIRVYMIIVKLACFILKGFTLLDVLKIRVLLLAIIKLIIKGIYIVFKLFLSSVSPWNFLTFMYYIFLGVSVCVLTFYKFILLKFIYIFCRIFYKLRFVILFSIIFILFTPLKCIYIISCIFAFFWDNLTDFLYVPWIIFDIERIVREALLEIFEQRSLYRAELAVHKQGFESWSAAFRLAYWYEKPFFFTMRL